jgi:energy-coupling factor transport system permease protein
MWKLRDAVVTVILSIVCGGIYRIWDVVVAPLLTITWVPGQGLINGLWWIAAALIPYIVRRPGAAFFAEIIAAVVELVLGGNWGFGGVLSGILQGAGAELAFLLFRYRHWNASTMALSGILAGIGYSFQWYFQYGGHAFSLTTILLYTLLTMVSGALLGGILPKLIADALNRAGVVRNFEIGRQTRKNARDLQL